MKKHILKPIYFVLFAVIISSCDRDSVAPPPTTNEVIEEFQSQTGLVAIFVMDEYLLTKVKHSQIASLYNPDDWATAKIPNNFDLYGGLPGQSEFYTIAETLIDSDTVKATYWERLQVRKFYNTKLTPPDSVYRDTVGIFRMRKDTIVVAISRVMANPNLGSGGAWQIYVDDYTRVLDTIPLDTIVFKI